jgi:hypothetical protein
VAACTWADTRGNMAALTQWRERLGLMFAADEARPE